MSAAKPLPVECPSCGEPMIRRPSKFTSGHFWGCSTFPKCRRTLPERDGDMMAVGEGPEPDEIDPPDLISGGEW